MLAASTGRTKAPTAAYSWKAKWNRGETLARTGHNKLRGSRIPCYLCVDVIQQGIAGRSRRGAVCRCRRKMEISVRSLYRTIKILDLTSIPFSSSSSCPSSSPLSMSPCLHGRVHGSTEVIERRATQIGHNRRRPHPPIALNASEASLHAPRKTTRVIIATLHNRATTDQQDHANHFG